ncbi:MAG: DNA/RNA nuclease SfsA [Myxococcota bacterium]
MAFDQPVVQGTLVRRYKRFLADVQLQEPDKETVVTAHVANTGSMLGLCDVGNKVLMSYVPSPKRRLAYSLQAIQVKGVWVGCNTQLPNRLVQQIAEKGNFAGFCGYESIRREVPYAQNNRSRIDLLLSKHHQGKPDLFVEVKNVTLRQGDVACFPDAVTQRGQKHLRDLMEVVQQGHRAASVFVVQRTDCTHFAPACNIDPDYAAGLRLAQQAGVSVWCFVAQVTSKGIQLQGQLPVHV